MDGGQNCSRTDFCLAIYGWGNILLVRLTVSVDGQKAVNGYPLPTATVPPVIGLADSLAV